MYKVKCRLIKQVRTNRDEQLLTSMYRRLIANCDIYLYMYQSEVNFSSFL